MQRFLQESSNQENQVVLKVSFEDPKSIPPVIEDPDSHFVIPEEDNGSGDVEDDTEVNTPNGEGTGGRRSQGGRRDRIQW